ncbi:MAG TPA: TrbI/VirB10 family protein, partial [Hydrogenophaga sp.]|nr:TrbI/VirB10 family protein [Hydrogenophaga sp.]
MNDQFPTTDAQNAVFNDNMPRLSSGLSRGVNKMAVAYVVLVSLAVIGVTFWVTSSAFSGEDKKKRVAFEDVEVPKKPEFRPAPPPPPPAKPTAELQAVATPLPTVPPVPPPRDDLLERRMASQNNLVASQQGQGVKTPFFENEFSAVKRGAVQQLANADFTLTRGTFIRCALETKVVSTHPGMTSCIVTEPIYSVNGRRLLVDKGSKVTGEYKYVDENFDRIGIVWTRILTTTGLDVRIDSAGTDSLGGAGVPGIYDGHWGERIGA